MLVEQEHLFSIHYFKENVLGKAAARIGDTAGGTIITGANSVVGEGAAIAHIDSSISTHGHGNHSHTPVVVAGSSNVLVEGKPAARIGDKTSCIHDITTGAGSITIGG